MIVVVIVLAFWSAKVIRLLYKTRLNNVTSRKLYEYKRNLLAIRINLGVGQIYLGRLNTISLLWEIPKKKSSRGTPPAPPPKAQNPKHKRYSLASRNPTQPMRSVDALLLRSAERTLAGLPTQSPPRRDKRVSFLALFLQRIS